MMNNKMPFNTIYTNYVIDKDLPIHKQLYELAKKEYFQNWEDDIVEEWDYLIPLFSFIDFF